MSNQRWLESLRVELARTELSLEYRARLYCELKEHLADLMEENEMSAENSVADVIGAPQDLACAAVHAQRPRAWRVAATLLLKVMVFGVLPLPLMVAAFAVVVLGIGAVATGLEWAMSSSFANFVRTVMADYQEFARLTLVALIVATACAVVAVETWLARRMQVTRPWPLLATGLISVLLALLFLHVQYTGVVGQNSLTLGLSITSFAGTSSLIQWAKGLVPLAIGIWMIRNSPTARLTPSISA